MLRKITSKKFVFILEYSRNDDLAWWSCHSLRHSKAMHLLKSGVNIVYIRDIFGHTSTQTTDIYARADSMQKWEALKKSVFAYNMFSTAKRLSSYETMGDLFREVASQMAELTLSERIWAIIVELLQFVADLIDSDFPSLVQSLMQKGDQQSKLMWILNFSMADAA